MDLRKFKEITKFYIGPLKEQLQNKNLRMKSHYVNTLENKPVKKNTVLLEAYHGVSITGNVYALFNELIKDEKFTSYSFYWATTDLKNPMIKKIKDEYPNQTNIHFIQYESKKYLELLATCEYLINDTSFMPYFIKRDQQVYINTWHGTPLKTLGLDIKNANLSDHKNIQRNFMHTDYMIMPNRFTADRLIKGHDLDGILNSKVYITGNPRVDLTLSTKKDKIFEMLNLPTDKKLVLYAPTWKKSLKDTTEEDILKLLDELKKIQNALGSEYKVLLKTHYFIYDYFVEHHYDDKIIPNWVDTNELLSCIDKLITDYSSIFFDFLPTKRPIHFYIPDKVAYENTRGFYLDLETLPGELCTTIESLCGSLKKDDVTYNEEFSRYYNDYLARFCKNDDQQSARRVIDIVFHNNPKREKTISYLSDKKKLLFYCGGFYNNGITNSAINLSKHIDYDKYEVIFMDTDKMKEEKANNIKRVDSRVHFIYKFSAVNRGYSNTVRQNLLYRQGADSKYLNKEKLKKHLNNEFKRVTGKLPVDILIDFGGYNKMFTALFAMSDVPRKVVYLHNVMMEEYNKKIRNKYKHKWNLKVSFSLYKYYDKIISVSKSADDQNKIDLGHLIPNYEEKMDYVNNSIDGDAIIKSAHVNNSFNNGKTIISSSDGNERIVFFEDTNESTGVLTLKGFLPPKENKINFVNAARLSPEKNHISLIEAFAKLADQNENCELYILGHGPIRNEIEQKISELDMQDKIHLLGHVSNPAMFINLCDCFILSSNYEGQGLVLLEAMIINKPVIGTDVPGIHSVLTGTEGLLVNNSIDDISQGMTDFINGKIKPANFDYKAYNEEAMNDFYLKVCGE
ncbi:CDP-glycerol glycerophosphotransferase family protein [Marinilactibacillus psychrotolerans]|uniref:CDP-glycerol glycerophosphotransferase family protein n=1 Tax=Marinilactibacillus psychrotolerans TaxID=191770 RepID=A0ABW8UNA7_9LACT